MAEGAASFCFKRSTRAQRVGITISEDGPARVSLSSVERGGVFRTVDGQNADLVGRERKQVYVIPKIENTFKFTPSFVPPTSDAPVGGQGEDRFELAAPAAAAPSEPQHYGLQHMRHMQRDSGNEGSRGLGGAITERLTAARQEEQAYQKHVEELPDMASVEAYELMPVDEFGKAILRGLGWTEGKGVGKNSKDVEPIEYLKRPERLGLGAQAVLQAAKPRQRKMGDAPEAVRREELVLAPDADGRQRHVRKLNEKLVHRMELTRGPRPGKEMAVVDGRHKGLRCVVIEVLPKEEGRSEKCRVRLKPSDEEDQVRSSELAELADLALDRQRQQLEERGRDEAGKERTAGRGRPKSNGYGHERERDETSGRRRSRSKERERAEDGGRKVRRGRVNVN